ncbi:MAG: hypothetical protein ACFCU5_15605 [Pleurocapsa sp.]
MTEIIVTWLVITVSFLIISNWSALIGSIALSIINSIIFALLGA